MITSRNRPYCLTYFICIILQSHIFVQDLTSLHFFDGLVFQNELVRTNDVEHLVEYVNVVLNEPPSNAGPEGDNSTIN